MTSTTDEDRARRRRRLIGAGGVAALALGLTALSGFIFIP